MKIAICWMGIGNYKYLWNEFYNSILQYFLNDCEQKTIFVFTDDKEYFKNYLNDNIILYEIQNISNSVTRDFILFRKFKYILYAEDQLLAYDYILFINGNAQILKPVYSNEICIPNKITCITHPYNLKISKSEPICNSTQTNAYFCVDDNVIIDYKQAGVICCQKTLFLQLANQIESWRLSDKVHGYDKFVPWHDETYYNKYLYCFCKDKLHVLDGKIWFSPKMHNNVKIFSRDKNTFFNKINLKLDVRTHQDIY